MAEQRICDNCGQEFQAQGPRDVNCLPCELVIRAVEPPELLKDMRLVYRNHPVATEGQKRMKQLFEGDPFKFSERLTKLEDQYRAACIKWESVRRQEAAPKKWDGKGACPGCGRGDNDVVVKDVGTAALIGRVELWMGKQPEMGNG